MPIKILTPEIIGKYFLEDKIYYSDHSMDEMMAEELGEIIVDEIVEAAMSGEILMEYPEDKPYPSVLCLGFTKSKRPIHFVCALDENRDMIVLITVYEPKVELWINHRERRKQ